MLLTADDKCISTEIHGCTGKQTAIQGSVKVYTKNETFDIKFLLTNFLD